jgi:mRNA interferase HigB
MRIISRKLLRDFWTLHPDAEQPLQTWYEDTKRANWQTPNDLKSRYRNASILANNRVVFNIKGNTYRLVGAINYQRGIVYLRFLGTHHEYDQIDATTI